MNYKTNAIQQGFSLIELLIVIAITAILAGIAVPLYSNYTSKAQVTRVFSELSSYRQPVEIHVSNNTMLLASSTPTTSLGFVDSNLSTVTFGTFTDAISNFIQAEIDGNSNPGIHGTEITLSRSQDGTWTCSINGVGSAWSESLTPNACQ